MLKHLRRAYVVQRRTVATRFVVIIYAAHLHFKLLPCLKLVRGVMAGSCPQHRCEWFPKAIMKAPTWTARHDYFWDVVTGVTRCFGSQLDDYARKHLSPDVFLYGTKTGKNPPKVLALPDKFRTDGKRQMKITEVWGPPAKRPHFVYNREQSP